MMIGCSGIVFRSTRFHAAVPAAASFSHEISTVRTTSPISSQRKIIITSNNSNTGNHHQQQHDNYNCYHRRHGYHTIAIARRVPKSFPSAISMSKSSHDSSCGINYDNAVAEHENYLAALRRYVPVLCLPPMDDLPDSVFVEDTVVAVKDKAVITNPGHPNRRDECATIHTILQGYLGMKTISMKDLNPDAYCDGGDVLYTGNEQRKHLFVGVNGTRTNREAVSILEDGLDVEAIPIPFEQSLQALHLKSIITHIDERTLLVPDNDLGSKVVQTMMDESNTSYDVVKLPSYATLSCNVVSVNANNNKKMLLAQLVNDSDHKTKQILEDVAKERDTELVLVTAKEAAKCDGALTCCSVLLEL